MPASYQAPMRRDKERKVTHSQTQASNVAADAATVSRLLEGKPKTVYSIRPQDTLHVAVDTLKEKRIGALVVLDQQGNLAGILSERDIVRKLAETPGKTLPQEVAEVMTSKVEVCGPGDTMVSVLRRMTAGKFRHMPVVDESGVLGMVTIGDVITYRLNELEHEALQLKQMVVG